MALATRDSSVESVKLRRFDCAKILIKYKCRYCDFLSDLLVILKDHIRSHCNSFKNYRLKVYACSNCNYLSYSMLVLHSHEVTCTYVSKEKNSGSDISYKSAQSNIKSKHRLYHECSQCSFKTVSTTTLRDHENAWHTAPDKIEWFFCERCEFKTKTNGTLHKHVKTRHDKNRMLYQKCSQCTFKTFCKKGFTRHMDEHKVKANKWFECYLCEYKAKQKWPLKNHIMSKHGLAYVVQCSHCSYKTSTKYSLRRHIIAHHTNPEEITWFDCDQCEYKAKQKYLLKLHIRSKHCLESVIQCSHCSYKTSFKDSLRKHMNARHTDPKEVTWFHCDQCEYKAKTKSQLKRHTDVKHGLADVVQCSQCSYETPYKENLRRHIKLKHGLGKLLHCNQ